MSSRRNLADLISTPSIFIICIFRCLMRWAIAAHDICFSKNLHSLFFAFGKSIPVVRGDGVYQPGVDFSISRLNEGHWVHLYPEVRVKYSFYRFLFLSWNVARYCCVLTALRMERQLSLLPPLATALLFASVRESGIRGVRIEAKKHCYCELKQKSLKITYKHHAKPY